MIIVRSRWWSDTHLREAGDDEPEQLRHVVMMLVNLHRSLHESHSLLPDELAAVQPAHVVHLILSKPRDKKTVNTKN